MYAHHSVRTAVQWEQNHTYIAMGGMFCAAAAIYDEVPEAHAWYDLGVKVIKRAVYLLDSPDGAFYEGLGYWNYGFALHLLPQLEMFRNVTGADSFAGFSSLRKLKYYMLHGLLPGGKYWLNVGDVAHSVVASANLSRARYCMLKLAAEYQDPELQFLAEYFAKVKDLEPANDPWTLGSWDPARYRHGIRAKSGHRFTTSRISIWSRRAAIGATRHRISPCVAAPRSGTAPPRSR